MNQQNILVISYSQTGQLHQILDRLTSPLSAHNIEHIHIKPQENYPFPWNTQEFFDKMPETVLLHPIPIKAIEFKAEKYDVIIVGYQPWFLSPSPPVTALFNNEQFLKKLKDTPVITVIGARNMWISAQKCLIPIIEGAGGRLIANLPFIDRHQNILSAFSILHWMLKGQKTRKWGILPKPGVSDADIENASKFGVIIDEILQSKALPELQQQCLNLKLIDIHPSIMLIEKRAKPLFYKWANLILKKGTNSKKRALWISIYKYYLIFALFIVSPIVLLIYNVLFRPFLYWKIRQNKEQLLYMGINNDADLV